MQGASPVRGARTVRRDSSQRSQGSLGLPQSRSRQQLSQMQAPRPFGGRASYPTACHSNLCNQPSKVLAMPIVYPSCHLPANSWMPGNVNECCTVLSPRRAAGPLVVVMHLPCLLKPLSLEYKVPQAEMDWSPASPCSAVCLGGTALPSWDAGAVMLLQAEIKASSMHPVCRYQQWHACSGTGIWLWHAAERTHQQWRFDPCTSVPALCRPHQPPAEGHPPHFKVL